MGSEATDAMVGAIYANIYSSLCKEDIQPFTTIVEANFPGAKVSS
jgi:hypothetical protein